GDGNFTGYDTKTTPSEVLNYFLFQESGGCGSADQSLPWSQIPPPEEESISASAPGFGPERGFPECGDGANPICRTASVRIEGLALVQAVQSRDLVSLRERRVVERRVPKVIDGGAQGENRLTDVDDLGRAFPDRMHAEDAPRVRIEQDLQKTDLRPQHLAL